MELWYCRTPIDFRPGGGRQIMEVEAFFTEVHRQLITNSPGIVVIEMQPGDGTRYRMCLAWEHERRVVTAAMSVPSHCVAELPIDDPRPTIFDEPMCDKLSEYTRAVFCDVLSACVWGDDQRYYNYTRKKPGPRGHCMRCGHHFEPDGDCSQKVEGCPGSRVDSGE